MQRKRGSVLVVSILVVAVLIIVVGAFVYMRLNDTNESPKNTAGSMASGLRVVPSSVQASSDSISFKLNLTGSDVPTQAVIYLIDGSQKVPIREPAPSSGWNGATFNYKYSDFSLIKVGQIQVVPIYKDANGMEVNGKVISSYYIK